MRHLCLSWLEYLSLQPDNLIIVSFFTLFSSTSQMKGPGGRFIATLDLLCEDRSHRLSSASIVPSFSSSSPSAKTQPSLFHICGENGSHSVALSVWSSTCGIHKNGSMNIWTARDSEKILNGAHFGGNFNEIFHDAVLLQWHHKGELICCVVNGEMIIVNLIWTQSKNDNKEVDFPSVALMEDEGAHEDIVALLAKCSLRIQCRKQLQAISLCSCDSTNVLLVGCNGGIIKCINWSGEILSEIMIPLEYSLFRIGSPIQLHLLVHDSTICNAENFSVDDSESEDIVLGTMCTVSVGDLPFICGFSQRLNLSVGHMLDGSMIFIHLSESSNEVTTRVVPVVHDGIAGPRGEEIVSKTYNIQLIDCPTLCCKNDCFIAAILVSRHFGESMKSNGNFRQSISLMVIRVARTNGNVPTDCSLNLSCCCKSDIILDISNVEISNSCLHLEVVYTEAEPLLLVSTSTFISCRSTRCCEVEIFNISFTELFQHSSLSSVISPAAYLSSTCRSSGVFVLNFFTVTLGKILIFGGSDSFTRNDHIKDVVHCKTGFVISIPLKISLSSQRLTQANGILLDVSSRCIHVYEEMDDIRSSYGTFGVLELPKRVMREYFQQHLTTSVASSTTSRLHQGRLLIAMSPQCPVPRSGLNSRFSRCKYLLCSIMAKGLYDTNDVNSCPVLWVFNRRTYRWKVIKTDVSSKGLQLSKANISKCNRNAAIQYEPGSLKSLCSLYWFGEHTIVLLGMRNARFHIDVISKGPCYQSHTSLSISKLCHSLPLHTGFKPTSFDAFEVRVSESIVSDDARYSRYLRSDDITFHTFQIVVADGESYFSYRIFAHQYSIHAALSYMFVPHKYTATIELEVDICRSYSTSEASNIPNFEYKEAYFMLSLMQICILVDASSIDCDYSTICVWMDTKGNLYDCTKVTNEDTDDFHRDLKIGKVFTNCYCLKKSSTIVLAAYNSQGKLDFDNFGISVLISSKIFNAFDFNTSRDSIFAVSQDKTSSYIWFPLLHDLAERILLNNEFFDGSNLISVNGSAGSVALLSKKDNKLKLFEKYEEQIITLTADEFLTKIAESHGSINTGDILLKAYSGEIYKCTSDHSASDRDSYIIPMVASHLYLYHLRQLPKLMNLTLTLFENTLMEMVENRRPEVGYVVLISRIFRDDELIALEILCRLSRQLDFHRCCEMFRYPYGQRNENFAIMQASWSVLSLFELSIHSGLLFVASRILTTCCGSDEIGGLESPAGAVRSLVLSVELLNLCLRRMSIKTSLDVLHFIFRLENKIGYYAEELLGSSETYEIFTLQGAVSDEERNQIQMQLCLLSDNSGEEGESVARHHLGGPIAEADTISDTFELYRGMGSQFISFSPTLSIISGGVIWSLSKTADALYYPFATASGIEATSYSVERDGNTPLSEGNFWRGPLSENYFHVCGSTTGNGLIEQHMIYLSAPHKFQQGVVTMMPKATGYSWPAYTFMDSIYGCNGVESLFHARLFAISFLFHFLRELLRNDKYCSCAVIAISLIPTSEDSRSAFFRLLCNCCMNIQKKEKDECGDFPIKEIIESILKSLSMDNLTFFDFGCRIKHSLSANNVHALCKEEFNYVQEFTHNKHTLNVVEPAPLVDLLFAKDMRICSLFLGLFTTFFVHGRRKVAAVIAVLLSRIDIACLCLKRSPLCQIEIVRLFQFCIGNTCEDENFKPEGTEVLMSLLDNEIQKRREDPNIVEGDFLIKIEEVLCNFVVDDV